MRKDVVAELDRTVVSDELGETDLMVYYEESLLVISVLTRGDSENGAYRIGLVQSREGVSCVCQSRKNEVDKDCIPEPAVTVARREASERKSFILWWIQELDVREDGTGC